LSDSWSVLRRCARFNFFANPIAVYKSREQIVPVTGSDLAAGMAGIPREERDAVLRRFYRRPGRASPSGHGLGLSVVTAILHFHRFIELADANPGLAARIFIPVGGQ
jgi:signal transduction histidine kinase